MMPLVRIAAVAICLLASVAQSSPATAEDTITRWYAMLVAVNENGLAKALSNDAVIRLSDIGKVQNKAEFLGTLGEWRIAIAGGGIRHKVEKAEGDVTTVLACYDFAENDILMRETFRIADGLITENTQTRVGENCDAY
jgi:hypothetical protein